MQIFNIHFYQFGSFAWGVSDPKWLSLLISQAFKLSNWTCFDHRITDRIYWLENYGFMFQHQTADLKFKSKLLDACHLVFVPHFAFWELKKKNQIPLYLAIVCWMTISHLVIVMKTTDTSMLDLDHSICCFFFFASSPVSVDKLIFFAPGCISRIDWHL